MTEEMPKVPEARGRLPGQALSHEPNMRAQDPGGNVRGGQDHPNGGIDVSAIDW